MKHNNKERNAAASPDYEYGMQNDDEADSNNAAPLPWLLEVIQIIHPYQNVDKKTWTEN